MVHVFRLGPLDIGGREAYAYAGVDADGAVIAPAVEQSDAEGLGAIAKRHAGQQLRCEPELADAARPLGFEASPLPEAALLPRATLAYGLALGPMAGRPAMDVLVRFLEACAVFWRARPWERAWSDEAIRLMLGERGRRREAEAAVMGAGGQEFGLALYDEPGSIQRVTGLIAEGRMKETLRFASLAITLDAEPAWAAAAIEGAFGFKRLPVPMRVRKGKASAPTTEELLDAAAALEAVARLANADDAAEAEATVEAGGSSVTARVVLAKDEGDWEEADLAEPMLVPDPIPATKRSKIPRNAPCPWVRAKVQEVPPRGGRGAGGGGPGNGG